MAQCAAFEPTKENLFMNLRKAARRSAGGLAVVAAVAVGWDAVAAADAGDAERGRGMRQMADLMHGGNPGMVRMHERMMDNDRAREVHESMMQDAEMAEMHESMMGAHGS